jgi:hypothetical protein
LEPEVHIVEQYLQSVKKCFLITNIMLESGNEIDLLVVNLGEAQEEKRLPDQALLRRLQEKAEYLGRLMRFCSDPCRSRRKEGLLRASSILYLNTTYRRWKERLVYSPIKNRGKARAEAVKPKTEKPKVPHVKVDFEMPTLEQAAEFAAEEAAKGTKSLTATDFRKHFSVPGKIPFNTRLKQLERSGYGRFSKIGRSNMLTLDVEAITSGKATVKGKAPKPKAEKKREEKK